MQTKPLFTFLVSILLIAGFFIPSHLQAKETDSKESTASAMVQTTTKNEYQLPYPGMLPDSPIYKVKVLRDKIISFLITDPQKKTDFYLLQADKGILASSMLVDKKNYSLAKETALKAEHNMTLIPEQLRRLQKKPESELFDRLILASQKHQEILSQIIKQSPKDEKKSFEQVLSFSNQNQSTIERYQKKNPRRWNEWNQ
jgi:hypothetical protein